MVGTAPGYRRYSLFLGKRGYRCCWRGTQYNDEIHLVAMNQFVERAHGLFGIELIVFVGNLDLLRREVLSGQLKPVSRRISEGFASPRKSADEADVYFSESCKREDQKHE